MTGLHKCAASGCKRQIATKYLMCPPHWRLVSQGVANDVYREYYRGLNTHRHPSEEYLDAVEAALAEVAAKETAK